MLELAHILQLDRIEKMLRELLTEKREKEVAELKSSWAAEHQGYTEGWSEEQHDELWRERKARIARLREIP